MPNDVQKMQADQGSSSVVKTPWGKELVLKNTLFPEVERENIPSSPLTESFSSSFRRSRSGLFASRVDQFKAMLK